MVEKLVALMVVLELEIHLPLLLLKEIMVELVVEAQEAHPQLVVVAVEQLPLE